MLIGWVDLMIIGFLVGIFFRLCVVRVVLLFLVSIVLISVGLVLFLRLWSIFFVFCSVKNGCFVVV